MGRENDAEESAAFTGSSFTTAATGAAAATVVLVVVTAVAGVVAAMRGFEPGLAAVDAEPGGGGETAAVLVADWDRATN